MSIKKTVQNVSMVEVGFYCCKTFSSVQIIKNIYVSFTTGNLSHKISTALISEKSSTSLHVWLNEKSFLGK